MPCYVVEYLWHVLLGEPGLLPWRSEDTRLPLALRFEGGRDTRGSEAIGFMGFVFLMAVSLAWDCNLIPSKAFHLLSDSPPTCRPS